MRNRYTVYDDHAEIEVSCRHTSGVCLIDLCDLERVKSFSGAWYIKWNAANMEVDAVIGTNGKGAKSHTVTLGRWILGLKTRDKSIIVYKSPNRLDNRRSNIEILSSRRYLYTRFRGCND